MTDIFKSTMSGRINVNFAKYLPNSYFNKNLQHYILLQIHLVTHQTLVSPNIHHKINNVFYDFYTYV